jgi:AbrB family looped-hinge helix DNA binding protein
MLLKLSSKGQFTIPKGIRRSLALEPGALFQVDVVNRKIILVPVSNTAPVDQLYGKYSGTDLLNAMEKEHRVEARADLAHCS